MRTFPTVSYKNNNILVPHKFIETNRKPLIFYAGRFNRLNAIKVEFLCCHYIHRGPRAIKLRPATVAEIYTRPIPFIPYRRRPDRVAAPTVRRGTRPTRDFFFIDRAK